MSNATNPRFSVFGILTEELSAATFTTSYLQFASTQVSIVSSAVVIAVISVGESDVMNSYSAEIADGTTAFAAATPAASLAFSVVAASPTGPATKSCWFNNELFLNASQNFLVSDGLVLAPAAATLKPNEKAVTVAATTTQRLALTKLMCPPRDPPEEDGQGVASNSTPTGAIRDGLAFATSSKASPPRPTTDAPDRPLWCVYAMGPIPRPAPAA